MRPPRAVVAAAAAAAAAVAVAVAAAVVVDVFLTPARPDRPPEPVLLFSSGVVIGAQPEPLHEAGIRAGVGAGMRGRKEGIPGGLADALATLQTVVDHAAAAVGEVEVGAGVRSGGETRVEGGAGEELVDKSIVGEEQAILSAVAAVRARSAAYGRRRLSAVSTRCGGGGGSAAAASAVADAAAARIDGGGCLSAFSCVSWHPSSGRVVYAEGASLFAEELDSSRRCALLSDSGSGSDGGGGRDRPGNALRAVVAVSPGGGFIARGTAQRAGGNGSLSIWSLASDEFDTRGARDSVGGGGVGGGGDGNIRGGGEGFEYPATDVVNTSDAESDGVVALAFSPSGSELCSVGGWDGTRSLLSIRPTPFPSPSPSPSFSSPSLSPTHARGATASARGEAGRVSAVLPSVTAAATNVVPLAAETRAICVLPRTLGEEGYRGGGADRPFLFVTGGEEGVALWLRISGGSGGGGDVDGGVQLLGTSAGVRSTALASVGRFVVAAELSELKGSGACITAIDVDWLAAGGNEGE